MNIPELELLSEVVDCLVDNNQNQSNRLKNNLIAQESHNLSAEIDLHKQQNVAKNELARQRISNKWGGKK